MTLFLQLCFSKDSGDYFKAGSWQKSPPVTVILLAAVCPYPHIYCLKVNMADCFPDFSACCKYNPLRMT